MVVFSFFWLSKEKRLAWRKKRKKETKRKFSKKQNKKLKNFQRKKKGNSLMVTRLAWIAHRLVSSNRCTIKSSVAFFLFFWCVFVF